MNLIPFYPYPREVSLFSFGYLSPILLVIAITTGCIILAKKQKVWLSAWGYYVVTLLPVIGIVQVGGQAMGDRYTYLPSLGPFLLAGLSAAWFAEKIAKEYQRSSSIKTVSAFGALPFLLTLSVLTIVQTAVWHDSISLWTSVIEKGSQKLPMAYVNRGAAYQKQGRLDRAIADYEEAIALDPSSERAYISLGTAYELLGQLDRAMAAVDKAIALNPSSYEAYRNRGILFEKMMQLESAIDDFTRAIFLKPSFYEAYTNRGVIYAKIGQYDKAIADYGKAIAINSNNFSAYSNRGISFTLIGQNDRALEDFDRAIELGQDDALAYFNRGMFFRRMGNGRLAVPDVRKACDLGNTKACSVYREMTESAAFQ
jgi:tetratricopeptide (TPR) repeat protein